MEVPDYESDYDAYRHPSSPEEVQELVHEALASKRKLRVRGALHSERGSVLLPDLRKGMAVMLDRLDKFEVDDRTKVCTAGAGISLGGDPFAPHKEDNNRQRDAKLSLFQRLDREGFALPVTGGISHQTLSGFISTGAAGGSTYYSFLDAVISLTLVDGTGALRTFERGQHDEFDGALVSLGLWGVLVELKLQCVERFDIVGLRSIQSVAHSDFKLFDAPGGKTQSLIDFLKKKEYARALWWPEPGVERLELWEATRLRTDRPMYGPITQEDGRVPPQQVGVPGPGLQVLARLIFDLFSEARVVDEIVHSVEDLERMLLDDPFSLFKAIRQILQGLQDGERERVRFADAGAAFLDLIQTLRRRNDRHVFPFPNAGRATPDPAPSPGELGRFEQIVRSLIKRFEPLSPTAVEGPWTDLDGYERSYVAQLFRDSWFAGLPMDNPVNDHLLPVTFTELWIPLEHAHEALRRLQKMFEDGRLRATGTFTIELYVAKASSAWLSPTQNRDVFRIDPFWFDDGETALRDEFFTQFWDALADLDMHFHWGKALSRPESATGADYRRRGYPELERFLALRRQYDPQNLFLNDYWKQNLAIDP